MTKLANNKPTAITRTVLLLLLLLYLRVDLFRGVYALHEVDTMLSCLPESPDVCVGLTTNIGPSLVNVCKDLGDDESCVLEYEGNYELIWDLVEGLNYSSVEYPIETIESAVTGVTIAMVFDYVLGTCKIQVGSDLKRDDCSACSISACDNGNTTDRTVYHSMHTTDIAYDCTNLENGISSEGECEQVANPNPFFFPFVSGTNLTIHYVVEAEDEGSNMTLAGSSSMSQAAPGLSSPFDNLVGGFMDRATNININGQEDEESMLADFLDAVSERVDGSFADNGPLGIENLKNTVQGHADKFKSTLGGLKDKMQDRVNGGLNGTLDDLRDAVEDLTGLSLDDMGPDGLKDAIQNLTGVSLDDLGPDTVNNLMDALKTHAGNVDSDTINNLLDAAKSQAGGHLDNFKSTLGGLKDKVQGRVNGGLNDTLDDLRDSVEELTGLSLDDMGPDGLKDAIQNLTGVSLDDLGPDTVNNLMDALKTHAGNVDSDTINNLLDAAKSQAGDSLDNWGPAAAAKLRQGADKLGIGKPSSADVGMVRARAIVPLAFSIILGFGILALSL